MLLEHWDLRALVAKESVHDYVEWEFYLLLQELAEVDKILTLVSGADLVFVRALESVALEPDRLGIDPVDLDAAITVCLRVMNLVAYVVDQFLLHRRYKLMVLRLLHARVVTQVDTEDASMRENRL